MKMETYQLETHESCYEEEINIVYIVITGFTFFLLSKLAKYICYVHELLFCIFCIGSKH